MTTAEDTAQTPSHPSSAPQEPSITLVDEHDLHAHIADLLNDTAPSPLAARIRAALDGTTSDVANISTQGGITV